MSIYSGFPTREDQTNYNKLLVKLVTTLQSQVLDLTNHLIPHSYASKYHKIIAKMQTYESHKYLPPKFSELFQPLLEAMAPRRTVQTETAVNQSRLSPLQEVNEEQEELGQSRKNATSHSHTNTQYNPNLQRKSLIRHRKLPQHRSILTENSQQLLKQNKKIKSHSLFNHKCIKKQEQFLKLHENMEAKIIRNKNYLNNRYTKNKNKTKTSQSTRINKMELDLHNSSFKTSQESLKIRNTMQQFIKLQKDFYKN